MENAPDYRAELTAVFGHPVAENPTVVMQEAGFRALDLNWRYLTIEVLPQDLEAAVNGARAFNMKGFNLTIPHKVEVLKYLDEVSKDAALMGAVNTVRRDGNRLIGENTDGKGFLYALRHDGNTDPAGKNFVVLGAGGAARAITVELALAGAGSITVVNRSEARGKALVELLTEKTSVSARFTPWDTPWTLPRNTDVLINATSIGLFPDTDALPSLEYGSIREGMLVCDVIPNPPRTRFLSEAEKRGARTLDGLGMLVYQGSIAFTMWTGREAPVDAMKAALEAAFRIGS